jgi:hypothetical protein
LGWAVKDSISNSVGVRVKIVSATDKALLRAARVREVCGNANHHTERNDNLAPNSRPGRDGVAERILATYRKSVSVASVTFVRCFPWQLILARDATVSPRGFGHLPQSPSVSSVRCFPLAANSRPGRNDVAERILVTYRESPLCDLRDLCAMLSLGS